MTLALALAASAAACTGGGVPPSSGAGAQRMRPRAQFTAVRGQPVAVQTPGHGWQMAIFNGGSVELRLPPGWTAERSDDQLHLALYPPGVTSQSGLPLYAFTVAPNVAFDPAAYKDGRTYQLTGLTGILQEPNAFATPTQALTITLPYRGGTFTISATTGPITDATPQLDGILQTLRFAP